MESHLIETLEECDQFHEQNNNDNSVSNKSSLQQAIDDSKFTIIQSIVDLGFFGWSSSLKTNNNSSSSSSSSSKNNNNTKIKKDNNHLSNVSSSDIKSRIKLKHIPNKVCNINDLNQIVCPQKYHNIKKIEYWNQYPYSIPYIASLHIADNISNIDFMFGGGSILQLLATKTTPTSSNENTKLLVQIVPTTNIIFISKYPIYRQNVSDVGFQFERFITDKKMNDVSTNTNTSSSIKNQHLQVFEIGSKSNNNKKQRYTILCSAECDGISNDENNIIEMKSSHQNFSQSTRVMFQMISNGSTLLYSGQNSGSSGRGRKNLTLQSIHENTLSDIIDKSLNSGQHDCATLERNIIYCLTELMHYYHNNMNNDNNNTTDCDSTSNNGKRLMHEIYFQSGRLMLRPCNGYLENATYLFFPADDVVKELLS